MQIGKRQTAQAAAPNDEIKHQCIEETKQKSKEESKQKIKSKKSRSNSSGNPKKP